MVNSQLVYYLGHGRITPVPDVARFDGASVELTDGRRVEPDLVITATGYLPRFEFLAPEILDIDADGRPDLHLHAFARRHPTLAVVGLLQADAGLFPLAHWQSVAVARWLQAAAGRPGPGRGGAAEGVDPADQVVGAAADGADVPALVRGRPHQLPARPRGPARRSWSRRMSESCASRTGRRRCRRSTGRC